MEYTISVNLNTGTWNVSALSSTHIYMQNPNFFPSVHQVKTDIWKIVNWLPLCPERERAPQTNIKYILYAISKLLTLFEKQYCILGKSILQVPDTGTSQYWWILEHFWCTSIVWKMWYLRSLERAGVIQTLTILECKNVVVLSYTRVLVFGTWSIPFPHLEANCLRNSEMALKFHI